jgi:SAM-dependent methyltransferase
MNRSTTPTDHFGRSVSWYDSRYDSLDADGHALRARMNAVLGLVGAGPGELLDAGMGPGRLCAELAGCGWTVSGVDVSAEMAEHARARLPEARARLLCAPIESLPFEDASFDVVTATGVLEYAGGWRALPELARVLRPGGRAVVSYPNPYALYGIWKSRLWYPLVRGGKRVLRRPDPELPRGAGMLPSPRFKAALAQSGLQPMRMIHASYLALITPLDLLLPRTTVRLGSRLEGSGPRIGSLLATQIVYEARRAGVSDDQGDADGSALQLVRDDA